MTLPCLFLERLSEILPAGFDADQIFHAGRARTLRINTLKTTVGRIHEWLKQQGISYTPVPWYEAAVSLGGDQAEAVFAAPAALAGEIYAQNLESLLPVLVLDPQAGQQVLDLCAAPGSKTTQIAAHMRNEGVLIANEPVRQRFYRLKSVVDLLGAKARLTMSDGRYFRFQELFDRVLVDAPCSSEGRFVRQEPKTQAYWSVRKIHEMAHKQKGLLLNASRLLKPGGVMVYSTCTFAPEENEAVVDWLLRKTAGALSIEPIDLPFIARYPALSAFANKEFHPDISRSFRVLPGEHMQGFFLAKFKKW